MEEAKFSRGRAGGLPESCPGARWLRPHRPVGTGARRRSVGGTSERSRRQLPGPGDSHHAPARGGGHGLRTACPSTDEAGAALSTGCVGSWRAHPSGPAPAPARGAGALRSPSSRVGRGPRVRPRLPPAPIERARSRAAPASCRPSWATWRAAPSTSTALCGRCTSSKGSSRATSPSSPSSTTPPSTERRGPRCWPPSSTSAPSHDGVPPPTVRGGRSRVPSERELVAGALSSLDPPTRAGGVRSATDRGRGARPGRTQPPATGGGRRRPAACAVQRPADLAQRCHLGPPALRFPPGRRWTTSRPCAGPSVAR